MNILTQALIDPKKTIQLSLKEWELLIAQAASCSLLGRLYYLFYTADILSEIPQQVLWHFESGYKVAEHMRINTRREIQEITEALSSTNITPVFLKGAMYAIRKLPNCFGRSFSDIDILVAKSEINDAEVQLYSYGWIPQKNEAYNEQYYRKWMHEIPPLQHAKRRTVLDLHHNILPLTNKNCPDASTFNTQELLIDKLGLITFLSDVDLVIHTAVHLFTESEFHHGLRDLSDIDMLIRHFCLSEPKFIDLLIERANHLGLSTYLWLALKYSALILSTLITDKQLGKLEWQPSNKLAIVFLNFCFINIFRPNHRSCRNWKMAVAEFFLYWRGHLIRMPLRLLIPHLARKSYMGIKDYFQKDNSVGELPKF